MEINFLFFCLLVIKNLKFIKSVQIHISDISMNNKLVYKNKSLSNSFYYNDFAKTSNCTCDSTYSVGKESNVTKFLITKNETDIFTPDIIYINNNSTYAYFNYREKNKTASELIIFHFCDLKGEIYKKELNKNISPYKPPEVLKTLRNEKEWSVVKFQFIDGNETHSFNFIKECEEESFIMRLLPSILIFILVILSTHFSIFYNFNFETAFRKFRDRRYAILNFISYLAIFLFFPGLNSSFDKFLIGCFFEYLVCFFFCIYQKVKRFFPNFIRRILRSRRLLRIKVSSILILILSFILLFFWYFSSYNFIFNNFFVLAVISYVVFLFRLENLSPVIFGMLSFFLTFLSVSVLDLGNVNESLNEYEISINYPLYFEIPKFDVFGVRKHISPTCSCIFADYLSITLNVIMLKYCIKVDHILYENFYFKRTYRIYHIFLIFCALANILYDWDIFRNILVFFFLFASISLCLIGYMNGVGKIIWRGKVLPGENLKKQTVIEIEIEKEINIFYKGQEVSYVGIGNNSSNNILELE